MTQDSVKLRNKCRFVTEIVQEVICPSKLQKNGLVRVLEDRGYDKLCGELATNQPNFDYLLNMKIVSFTLDLASELQGKYQERVKEIELFSKQSLATLWLDDLQELREGILQLYKEREEERNEHLKLKVQSEVNPRAQTKSRGRKRGRAAAGLDLKSDGPSGKSKSKKGRVAPDE